MHELEAIGGKNPFSPPLAFFWVGCSVCVQGREKLKAIDLLSSAINFQLSCWDKNFWAKNGSSRVDRDSTRTAGSNVGVMTIPERFVDPLLQMC